MTLLTPTDHVVISNCIMGLENKTNAFFLQTCPCINDCRDPDLPALLVYLMYLNHINVSSVILVNRKCKSINVISKTYTFRDPYR